MAFGFPSWWPGLEGFVGWTADAATGLENLGAREYDPASSSFTSPDPLLTPDNPQDLNPYAYALDDPASESDPTGAEPIFPTSGGSCVGSAQYCGGVVNGNGGGSGGGGGGGSGGGGGGGNFGGAPAGGADGSSPVASPVQQQLTPAEAVTIDNPILDSVTDGVNAVSDLTGLNTVAECMSAHTVQDCENAVPALLFGALATVSGGTSDLLEPAVSSAVDDAGSLLHQLLSPNIVAHAMTEAGEDIGTGGADSGGDVTRVGRWMSRSEFDQMSNTGRVVEGAGGRTYVVTPPDPAGYVSAANGSVYAEFDVPSDVLKPASQPNYRQIPGPNIATRMFGPPPDELAPATCIVLVCDK